MGKDLIRWSHVAFFALGYGKIGKHGVKRAASDRMLCDAHLHAGVDCPYHFRWYEFEGGAHVNIFVCKQAVAHRG